MQFDSNKRNLFRRKKSITTDNLLPWIKESQNFLEKCTQCTDCIKACPEQIIVKGDGGFPNIDFTKGECTFCGLCADSCNEDIFVETTQVPWFKKAVIKESCLAEQNIYCRSCAESCEFEALFFKIGLSEKPQINLELCNGCGACYSPCPTQAIEIKEILNK